MTRTASRFPVFAVGLLAATLSGLNWAADPANMPVWAGVLAAALIALAVNAFFLDGTSDAARERDRNLRRSLFLGLGLLSLALAFAFANEFGLAEGADKRATLVGIGLILAITGNYLPKTVLPIAAQGRDPARRAAAERLTGRIFVLCGLAFAVAALAVPLGYVTLATGAFGMLAFISAVFAWFWVAGGRQQTQED
ncbi:hypothetical protein L5876_07420 [Hyphobacterium sp. SN044]|uniref:hypothetical protein n=1 Tax=Hyphobacterium sp. SN044 TaxID=2912575 RepID=UPI001F359EE7|nr:hypothetical protein [Hyphobacterium sp. SN044]MCF8879638.1 hypothetical protein [Hyphobacterium sp. SN044]